ncbi:MAG: septation protein A [Alphaproteobacteria bacterium]|nr:septation protein A [Alphaproteobacteria bacterium]
MIKNSPSWLKPAIDYGPLLVFFVAYSFSGLWVATGALMATTVVAIAVSYWAERRVPMVLVATAVVVLVFGGLTFYFDDDRFIKMKPTIIQALFAVVLLGGLAVGKPLLKPVMSAAWELTDRGWTLLSLRFGLFFAVMAVLNEIVWRTQSTDFWVNYKVFGAIVLTLIFTMAQMPLITRHQVIPVDDDGDGD